MLIAFVFVFALVIGVPIAFMLGLTGIVHLLAINPEMLVQLPQRIFYTAVNYSLLAIPLFILAGDLMNLSGDVDRLFRFARALFGKFKGGLCYVTIFTGLLMGSSLASANAEAAMLSTTIYPKLREDGYDPEFLSGLIAATSVCGPMIPPGMLMVVYGVAAGVSIKELFMAGIMVGVLIALSLSVVVFFIGKRHADWPTSEFAGWREVGRALWDAKISIFLPICVLLCIATGVCSATEAAAVLAFLFLLNGLFNYKTIRLKDLAPIFMRSGILSGAILMIAAMGGVFGWTLAFDQVPQKIAAAVVGLTKNPYIVLLILNVLVLFLGMIMDATPAVMILVPVLTPLILQMGYDPVHFGMIICYNLTIGLLTPPVGTVLYTTSMATGVDVNRMFRSIWPWVLILVFVLMLISYVPDLVMWIPNLIRA